jgi:hypothetical protein
MVTSGRIPTDVRIGGDSTLAMLEDGEYVPMWQHPKVSITGFKNPQNCDICMARPLSVL